MTSSRLRRWPLLLCFLVLVLQTFPAAASQSPAGSDVAQTILHEGAADVDVPGAAALQEAQGLLQKLRVAPRRYSRFTKPSGLLGTFFHYAKEVFVFLFLKGTPVPDSSGTSKPVKKLSEPLASAVRLLEDAATLSNLEAMYTLADLNFYGRYGHPRNFTKAFEEYERMSLLDGNSSAQHMLGFMYSTGIGGVVERDQARAMVYHKYAADGGNTRAQMTMGFRFHAGIATPRNCEAAMRYYKKVAEKAMVWVRSGPPGGRQVEKEAYKFADEDGGIYGEGASVSSSGRNAKQGGPNSDAHAAFDDVLEYLDLMSRKGDLKATFGLGRLHYEGSRNLPQDYAAAKDFFKEIARRYWKSDGTIKSDVEPGVERLASKAAGYLGRMFLRGEGVEQNFRNALIWFRRGIHRDNQRDFKHGDALCQYSLGLMHLYGLEVEKSSTLAAEYFSAAADQDFAAAQVRLGALFLDQGDVSTATKYFDIAAHHGHIEAFYYLAEISNIGTATRERSCNEATVFYKIVAEKAEPIHSSFIEANTAYDDGDYDTALIGYMQAAEQGYEVGQANVGYLLDRTLQRSSARDAITRLLPTRKQRVSNALNDPQLAHVYWTRSSRQANVDSMVKTGDYYLDGIGVPSTENTTAEHNAEKAAACYTAAADTLQSAQAMWNLGWMHENGLGGLAQDFHLAKRYYDQALETNDEAYLPVTLALMRLRLRSAWNQLTGGSAVSIRSDDDDDPRRGGKKRTKFSWAEWIANFMEADLEMYEEALRREQAAAAAADGLDDWDLTGAAAAAAAAANGGGNGNADNNRHDAGGERYGGQEWHGGEWYGGGNEQDDIFVDDGLVETILIVGLAFALAVLLYYRQIQQLRARQEREREDRARRDGDRARQVVADAAAAAGVAARPAGEGVDRPDEDRGLFPRPEDPEFAQWAVGGVGH